MNSSSTDSPKVILIGMGGHAVSVRVAFESIGREIAGYVDQEPVTPEGDGLTYLGNDSSHLGRIDANAEYFCTIGDNRTRSKVQRQYAVAGARFTNCIHAEAHVEPSASIGAGSFVGAFAYVNGLVEINEGCIINNRVTVEHHCIIEDFCHLAPGSILAGRVQVGPTVMIGVGAVVIPEKSIGQGAVIGAGSIVISDVPKNTLAYGNPCRNVKTLT